MHGTVTGIGRALRRARQHRGRSLEEASRETRIRIEYLDALEIEDFPRIPGDVYVRGFLRTYSSYLGLSSDKVLEVYERAFGPQAPSPDPTPREPAAAAAASPHPHDHRRARRIAIGGAIGLLAVAGALGLLNRTGTVPEAADAPSSPATSLQDAAASPEHRVTLAVLALEDVDVVVEVDAGAPEAYSLTEGESRSFEGVERIGLEVSEASSVELTVNGESLGRPAIVGPLSAEYGPSEEPSPSPSRG